MKKPNSLPTLTLLLLFVFSLDSNAQQNTESKPLVENQFTTENYLNQFDMNKIDKKVLNISIGLLINNFSMGER